MPQHEKKDARLHIRIEGSSLRRLQAKAKQERLPFSLWLRRILEALP